MTCVYRIPVVYNQPTPAESFHQSLDSLVTLNATINDIFAKLSSRVTDERTRLDHLVKRIEAAEVR